VVRANTRGLTLVLLVFAALIVAAGLVGRYGVAPDAPNAGAQPGASAPIRVPASTGNPAPSTPTTPATPLPSLPTRPADALAPWATPIADALGIPEVAMQAYGYAQVTLARLQPGCHLGWTTLAAFGTIESDHGRTGGAQLLLSGRSDPVINGPVLDGLAGRALVHDTDAGGYDGDPRFDRAMGPLHLMPAVWRVERIDADGDGILDPYDIDDAALALGRLLCTSGDLSRAADWRAAVGRYQAGKAFADAVFAAADDYGRRSHNIG
jgi:membrane-bound lytic murein transglycosylase B